MNTSRKRWRGAALLCAGGALAAGGLVLLLAAALEMTAEPILAVNGDPSARRPTISPRSGTERKAWPQPHVADACPNDVGLPGERRGDARFGRTAPDVQTVPPARAIGGVLEQRLWGAVADSARATANDGANWTLPDQSLERTSAWQTNEPRLDRAAVDIREELGAAQRWRRRDAPRSVLRRDPPMAEPNGKEAAFAWARSQSELTEIRRKYGCVSRIQLLDSERSSCANRWSVSADC
jgi:hypothetical protein